MRRGVAVVVLLLLPALVRAQAQINPATVHVVNSPNVLTWPATTRIDRIEVTEGGLRVAFDRCDAWPHVTPPGWQGPLTHTLWLFLEIGGEWYASGIIQFWACEQFNGGAIFSDDQIARNWVYDARWSSMVRHQPAPGERIGFMVSAGNARGQDDHVVRERSDIVEIAMPSGPRAYPPFLATESFGPAPLPTPTPVPIPVPTPAPIPSWDPTLQTSITAAAQLAAAQLAAAKAEILTALDADTKAVRQDVAEFRAAVRSKWQQVGEPIVKYILPTVGAAWAAFLAGKKAQ